MSAVSAYGPEFWIRSMRPRASRWMAGADGVGIGGTAVQADSRAKARMSQSLRRWAAFARPIGLFTLPKKPQREIA